MRTPPDQSFSPAVSWSQEWQRLSWTATTEAMGHYFHDYANLALARTPQQALSALHKVQAGLLRHSAESFAEATRLWRKQNSELLVLRALGDRLQ